MPLDPSIILGGQAPQIQNPLDMQTKYLTMRHLAQANQAQDQTFSDDQALRSAYKNNMTVGPDGTPVVNKAGLMSQYAPQNPKGALDLSQSMTKNDLEMSKAQIETLKAQHEQAADIAMSVPTDPNTPMEVKQAAYTAARQRAIQAKLPGAAESPEQYIGDNPMKQAQLHTMTAQQQFAQQNSDRDYQIKSQHEKTYEKDIGERRQAQATAKESTALQQTSQALMTARGDGAYQQANKDLYNVTKANTLANLYGDPDKLSSQQVNLLVSELGKIATGGVPSMHELDGLTPGTLTGKMAAQWSKLSNDPTPANAGEFVKQYQSYANAIGDDAKKFMIDRDKRVLDTQRSRIGEANYKNLSDIHLKRFDQAPDTHPQDDAAMDWAKKNPNDPMSAQILKLNGTGQ